MRLSVLMDRSERMKCSSLGTLNHFVQVASRFGIEARLMEDIEEPPGQWDGLFLRCRPRFGNRAHRLAERFWSAGLPVIDSPKDILIDLDKVLQGEIWKKAGLRRPATIIAVEDEADAAAIGAQLGFPVVVKTPDGAFCDGVECAGNVQDLDLLLELLHASHRRLVCQEWIECDYDWRIGVLEGEPLYACKYYRAKGDWRIIKPSINKSVEGRHRTISLSDVPPEVTQMAVDAARASGVSLAGVDIKRSSAPVLIEINANPTIEHGIEDAREGDAVWERIALWFKSRIAE